jgi:enterochelin esterase-like enzyme
MRFLLALSLAALCLVPISAGAQSRLDDAGAVLESRNWALEEAWETLAGAGLPLIEPHPIDEDLARVTFAYRGDPTITGVRLDSVVNAPEAAPIVADYRRDFTLPMQRLAGSQIWTLTLDIPRDVQAVYSFLIESGQSTYRRTDPANRRSLRGLDGESLLVLDRVGDPSAWWPVAQHQAREMAALVVDSEALGRSVLVQHYPAPDAPPDAPVLVLYDAFLWSIRVPAWEIAHNLAEAGLIPPTHVVLIDQLDEASAGHAYADQAAFLADELLPDLRDRAGIAARRETVVVAGASRRGLSAVIAGLQRPDEIGGVLSLSGSFYWAPQGERPEWLLRRLTPDPGPAARFYLAAGSLEYVRTSTNRGHVMLDTNRRIAQALGDVGYEVEFEVFAGGHDVAAWRAALAEGLVALLGDADE